MKKEVLIIIILIVFGVFGLVLLGRRGSRRGQWFWLRKSFQAEESPQVSLTPTPAIQEPTATPQPLASPQETLYQTSISEADFNNYLAQAVAKPIEERHLLIQDNPFTAATISMQEEVAVLNMHFEKGQDLTGEIFVSADGKNLDIRNVTVTEAGGFESLFAEVASLLIKDGLDDLIVRIAQSAQIETIEIKPGSLVIFYKLI